MNKKILVLNVVIIVFLSISCYLLFQENTKLKGWIGSYKNFTYGHTMRALPKDWIIPMLSEDNIDIESLYRLESALNTSFAFTTRTFGIGHYITSYSEDTSVGVRNLISLIESEAPQEEIDSLIEELIDLQEEMLEEHLSNPDAF